MNRPPKSVGGLNRRELLRSGGLVLSMGALVAACGSNRGGSTAAGRLGVAEPPATVPEGSVDDLALLRTAQSLEYTALAVYDAAGGLGVLDAAESALAARFVDDHTRHALTLGDLIVAAGGEEFQCANPFAMDRLVNPLLAALDGTDDLHRDVLSIAHGFEAVAGASYQSLVAKLQEPALRKAIMQIGTEEQRHAAVLARAINPATPFSPVLTGGNEEPDADGFPIPHAIPSVFGRVNAIELTVGAPNDEGARFSTQLQTPAENTIVYSFQSC